jgi:hypothetical protein
MNRLMNPHRRQPIQVDDYQGILDIRASLFQVLGIHRDSNI